MLRALAWPLLIVLSLAAEESAQYRQAFEAGVEEAEGDIAAGTARLLVFGMPTGGPGFDAATGLPTQAIAGCIVDDGILGRAAGYNQTVRAWHAEHGSVPGSLSDFRQLIVDPAAAAAQGSVAPTPGIGTDPTGIHHLRFVDGNLELVAAPGPDAEEGDEPEVLMFLAGVGDGEAPALVWGPPGSDLLVVGLPVADGGQRLNVFDLRRRLRLHTVVSRP